MSDKQKILVWKVEAGPLSISDIDEDALDTGEYVVTLLVSDPDDPDNYGDLDLWFPTFDDCYSFCSDLHKSMEPLEIEV
jgi:hypothetical protein